MPTKTGGRTAGTLLHHVEAFTRGDLDALMSDYCDDAVLIAQDGVYRGSGEIRAFFEKFLAELPAGSVLEASQRIAERTIAYVVWSGRRSPSERLDLPFAIETLIVREGRILTQTFTAHMDSNVTDVWRAPRGGKASPPTRSRPT